MVWVKARGNYYCLCWPWHRWPQQHNRPKSCEVWGLLKSSSDLQAVKSRPGGGDTSGFIHGSCLSHRSAKPGCSPAGWHQLRSEHNPSQPSGALRTATARKQNVFVHEPTAHPVALCHNCCVYTALQGWHTPAVPGWSTNAVNADQEVSSGLRW
jgi:hypothetical protein